MDIIVMALRFIYRIIVIYSMLWVVYDVSILAPLVWALILPTLEG